MSVKQILDAEDTFMNDSDPKIDLGSDRSWFMTAVEGLRVIGLRRDGPLSIETIIGISIFKLSIVF